MTERNDLSDQIGQPGETGTPEGATGPSDLDPVTATEGMPGADTSGADTGGAEAGGATGGGPADDAGGDATGPG